MVQQSIPSRLLLLLSSSSSSTSPLIVVLSLLFVLPRLSLGFSLPPVPCLSRQPLYTTIQQQQQQQPRRQRQIYTASADLLFSRRYSNKRATTTFVLFENSSPIGNSPNPQQQRQQPPDFNNEETLLQLELVVNLQPQSLDPSTMVDPNNNNNNNNTYWMELAMKRVSAYCQSFPFAAILPVQPLNYLPTADGGVDIRFLRKPTESKSGTDGGMRFFLSQKTRDSPWKNDDATDAMTTMMMMMTIEILVKRNSFGQTFHKLFSEKRLLQSFVEQITTHPLEVQDERQDHGAPLSTTTATISVQNVQFADLYL